MGSLTVVAVVEHEIELSDPYIAGFASRPAIAAEKGHTKIWRTATALVAVLAVGGLVGSQHHLLSESATALSSLDWRWLAPAAGVELVSMVAFAAVHRRLLRVGDVRLSVRSVTALAFASNAISSSLPLAGSEFGTAYTFRQLQNRGADRVTAAWVLAISGVASSVTFSVIVSVAAISSGELWGIVGGLVGSVLIAVGVALIFAAFHRPTLVARIESIAVRAVEIFYHLRHRWEPSPREVVHRAFAQISSLSLGSRDVASVVTWSSINWLADALCLAFTLLASHTGASWSALILAWAAGATVSSFQLTPGGLGVVEASVIAALAVGGVPGDRATAAVLVYRVASYWLVVFSGWVLFAVQRRAQHSY